MKSTTEQRLQTCIHSDTCPPIQLITNNDPIPSLSDTYLHYTKPFNALPIHKTLNLNKFFTEKGFQRRHIFPAMKK